MNGYLKNPSNPTTAAGDDVPMARMSADTESQEGSPDDLPDIVDLVMQMGRLPEDEAADEPTVASPPPLSVVAGGEQPHVPGHLEHLADRARGYVEAASSANTRRAYASDWKQFASWCRRQIA